MRKRMTSNQEERLRISEELKNVGLSCREATELMAQLSENQLFLLRRFVIQTINAMTGFKDEHLTHSDRCQLLRDHIREGKGL